MIVILLFVQAYCDLSLPSYTSDIVDVGIQQGGIENAVPLQIRKQTLQEIELFLTEEQKELVEQCYQEQEELWVLQNIEESKKEELNHIFAKPMNVLLSAKNIDAIRALPTKERNQKVQELLKPLDMQPDSVIEQSAVLFLKQEYAAQGMNLAAMQIQYIIKAGFKMILFALLIMGAAVSVK